MNTFELSSFQSKNGRRKFKVILYKIFPDSCIDEQTQTGTEYNENGITWIREYCEKALPSIEGMSLRCEFLDEERTELCGHGATEISPVDGLPVFENAVVIGTFDKGYIEEIETPDEGMITVCIGEGTIDGLCYHNFCEKLEKDIADGNAPYGSVEILKTGDNDGILYKYGYKDKGRIPMVFEHSGYALLGIRPADQAAKILELNNKEDENMTEEEARTLIEDTVKEVMSVTAEMEQYKQDCDAMVAEANAAVAEKDTRIAELEATIDDLNTQLEQKNAEYDEMEAQRKDMEQEIGALKASIVESEKKDAINELNAAIARFTDEEKAYAADELAKFNEDPDKSMIDFIVNKILMGIGRKMKEREEQISIVAETNASGDALEDIFAEVSGSNIVASESEDDDIFK